VGQNFASKKSSYSHPRTVD